MFLITPTMCSTRRFRCPAGSLGAMLTPSRPSTLTSNVLPLSGNLFFSCIRASRSEPRVSCLHRQGFRTLGTRDGQLSTGRLLRPQAMGKELSHNSHSASRGYRFRRRGVHSYSWLSASPKLIASTVWVAADAPMKCPTSITNEDEVDRRVFEHPAQSQCEKTSTNCSSACRP